jgi:hypothetical protein
MKMLEKNLLGRAIYKEGIYGLYRVDGALGIWRVTDSSNEALLIDDDMSKDRGLFLDRVYKHREEMNYLMADYRREFGEVK